MPVLLTYPRLMQIARLARQGVPARAAASAFGITPRTLQGWLTLGSGLDVPRPPPVDKDKLIEVEGGGHITESEWWAHEYACWTLARAVLEGEGACVARLVKDLWKQALPRKVLDMHGREVMAPADTGVQMFLFKHYKHVHGLNEKMPEGEVGKGSKVAPEDVVDTSEKVVFYIPDNGRGPTK